MAADVDPVSGGGKGADALELGYAPLPGGAPRMGKHTFSYRGAPMRKLALIGTVLLTAIAGACSTTPTTPAVRDARPSFDGGFLGGSGNNRGGDSTVVTTTSTTTVDSTGGGTGRGGFLGGSGN
jgi:hypothetical protein